MPVVRLFKWPTCGGLIDWVEFIRAVSEGMDTLTTNVPCQYHFQSRQGSLQNANRHDVHGRFCVIWSNAPLGACRCACTRRRLARTGSEYFPLETAYSGACCHSNKSSLRTCMRDLRLSKSHTHTRTHARPMAPSRCLRV